MEKAIVKTVRDEERHGLAFRLELFGDPSKRDLDVMRLVVDAMNKRIDIENEPAQRRNLGVGMFSVSEKLAAYLPTNTSQELFDSYAFVLTIQTIERHNELADLL